jgi:hypothetical protein
MNQIVRQLAGLVGGINTNQTLAATGSSKKCERKLTSFDHNIHHITDAAVKKTETTSKADAKTIPLDESDDDFTEFNR